MTNVWRFIIVLMLVVTPPTRDANATVLSKIRGFCERLLGHSKKKEVPKSKPPEYTVSEAISVLHGYTQSHFGRTNMPTWARLVQNYLDPYVKSDSKEVAFAVIGSANSGKSTFFNMIPSYLGSPDESFNEISRMGLHAGQTLRPILLTNSDMSRRHQYLEQRFGTLSEWRRASESTEPGSPLVYGDPNIFDNLIFIDTPAFDVSELREQAEKAFINSDALIYIFSGASYKNEWTQQYLQEKFKDMGTRPAILIYRSHPQTTQAEASVYLREVAESLYPDSLKDPETGLPVPVLGAYSMVESDVAARNLLAAELIPLFYSEDFKSLVSNINSHSEEFRMGSLQKAISFALDGFSDDLNSSRLVPEEIRLTRDMLDLVVASSVISSAQNIPYYHLADELETVWFGYSMGLRGFSRMIANPGDFFRGGRRELKLTGKGLSEIDQFLKASVDYTITQFLLAISRGTLKISTNAEGFEKVYNEVQAFRRTHEIQGNAPNITKVDDKTAVLTINTSRIQENMREYLNRDWDAISEKSKEDVSTDFRELTGIIQGEFQYIARDALKKRGLFNKATGAMYPLLAISPFLVTTYIGWTNNWGILDVQTILSLLASWQVTRFFVNLDERHIKKEWVRVIDSWYERRERPRLLNILRKNIMPIPPEVIHASPEMVQYANLEAAAESLTRQSLLLLPRPSDDD